VYLSLMHKNKRQAVLAKIGLPAVTKYTITDMEKLEQDLLKTKELGYGFEDQELREGVRRVAAPIFGTEGNHIGCIGLSATIFSFDLEDTHKYGTSVLDCARRISDDMASLKPTF
jgi:DNA-binding IclR family transcriptional regulator